MEQLTGPTLTVNRRIILAALESYLDTVYGIKAGYEDYLFVDLDAYTKGCAEEDASFTVRLK